MSCSRVEPLVVASIILVVLAAAGAADAHRGDPPLSSSKALLPLDEVDVLQLEPIDREKELAEDRLRQSDRVAEPLRYGVPQEVDVTPASLGTWERLADGARLWRLRLLAEGATDLSCGFTTFRLPPGATLHLLSEADDLYQGPYGVRHNKSHRQLWTPVVLGERAVLELFVPAEPAFEPELQLRSVIRGYRDLFGKISASGDQGRCNIDVICARAYEWRNEIRSVAMITLPGGGACTANMIMNTRRDFRNLVLSANHCGINSATAPGIVFYWNFNSPECGRNGGGSLVDNQTGSIFLAAREDSDFALVELDDDPDPESAVYYSGWDATGAVPQASVAIHQPAAAEKAISFNDDPLTIDTSCIDSARSPNTHWWVDNWEEGTTERGSSGGGLWDPATHLLVGYLSGGLASCTNIDYDCFGRINVAWTGSSAGSRLSDWLDPEDTGELSVAGAEPTPRLSFGRFESTSQCGAGKSASSDPWRPGGTVTISVDLSSSGSFTGIHGTLTSSTPGITILDGTAQWPDMVAGDLATSNAPHFTIRLDRAITCPGDISLALAVDSNEGATLSTTLINTIGVGAEVPLDIVDSSTVTSELVMAADAIITDVNVEVDIKHSWVGDLTIELRSPNGTTVTLLDRPGHPNSVSGCGDDDMDVVFDDSAADDLEDHCLDTIPWFTGTARPVGSLADFNGESMQGTWSLLVTDSADYDTGWIADWRLVTTPANNAGCTPCEGTGQAPEPRVPSGRVRPVTR